MVKELGNRFSYYRGKVDGIQKTYGWKIGTHYMDVVTEQTHASATFYRDTAKSGGFALGAQPGSNADTLLKSGDVLTARIVQSMNVVAVLAGGAAAIVTAAPTATAASTATVGSKVLYVVKTGNDAYKIIKTGMLLGSGAIRWLDGDSGGVDSLKKGAGQLAQLAAQAENPPQNAPPAGGGTPVGGGAPTGGASTNPPPPAVGGKGEKVYRELSEDDRYNYDRGFRLQPRGQGGSITDHVQGYPTKYISASQTAEAAEKFSSGNGLAEIDVEQASETGTGFVPHENVLQHVRRHGRPIDLQTVKDAEETLMKGGVDPSAITIQE